MINFANSPHNWSTASNGFGADTLPGELEALGEHLDTCQSNHRHLLSLHCAVQKLGDFLAARFVTTVVFVIVFLGVNIWLF